MPILNFQNVSYQFDDGETLFSSISINLNTGITGLVGDNGCGKSTFVDIALKRRNPSTGSATVTASFGFYLQEKQSNTQSIAEYLNLAEPLEALQRIEQGSDCIRDFELLAERWQIREELSALSVELGIPYQPDMPCEQLSGGQWAKLQLHMLFESGAELLVLDEPSNHLDGPSKDWLINKMRCFDGCILLVTHDRELLQYVQEIWLLEQKKLKIYGGNYQEFERRYQLETSAIERDLLQAKTELNKAKKLAQRNLEKAQQRAASGKRQLKSGSQPKILMDAKINRAAANGGARLRKEKLNESRLKEEVKQFSEQQAQRNRTEFQFQNSETKRKTLLELSGLVLPFGDKTSIQHVLRQGDKCHLQGDNGTGKSTLLTLIKRQSQQELTDSQSSTCRLNSSVFYLDQHYSVLPQELSLFETVQYFVAGCINAEARTLLSQIGFRRDSVFRKVSDLSGGEKMKLSMLVASQKRDKPLLLLDEPDNHLDLRSKQNLAAALRSYKGAFLLVSHDRWFVRESGVNQVLSLNTP